MLVVVSKSSWHVKVILERLKLVPNIELGMCKCSVWCMVSFVIIVSMIFAVHVLFVLQLPVGGRFCIACLGGLCITGQRV